MNKKKKNSTVPRVTSRSKKHPLKIESIIKVKNGIRLTGKKGSKTKGHKPIALTVVISREDLYRLHDLTLNEREYFLNGFYAEFIVPALKYVIKGARGKFKGKGTTLRWLKREACELYHLFLFLLDEKRQPSYFKKLLAKVNKHPEYSCYVGDTAHKDAITLTLLCLGTYLSQTDKKDIGPRSFVGRIESGTLKSFYDNYIRGCRPIYMYSETITDDQLKELADEPPFSYIFEILKLI